MNSTEQAVKKAQADIEALHEAQVIMGRQIQAISDILTSMQQSMKAMSDEQSKMIEEMCTSRIAVALSPIADQLEDLTTKVDGRNKSAAVKRNMTDADAHRVLNGDLASMNHKEAADVAGLTYAQVYSCRGGFTFKHVIHDLEKAGWKNTWEKPKKQGR